MSISEYVSRQHTSLADQQRMAGDTLWYDDSSTHPWQTNSEWQGTHSGMTAAATGWYLSVQRYEVQAHSFLAGEEIGPVHHMVKQRLCILTATQNA